MWPPTAIAKVTAGFTCPPEMSHAMNNTEDKPNAFAIADTTKLVGFNEASGINFPVIFQIITKLYDLFFVEVMIVHIGSY